MTTQDTWRGDPHPHPGLFLSILFIVAALTLAACSSSGSPIATTISLPQSTAIAPDKPTADPSAASTQPSAALPIEPPATASVVDSEFHPSDPATVSLAAGRPQFVEFFAFW